LQKFFNLLN